MTRRHGFTLIEVMLALALVALVAGLTFGMLIEMGSRERSVSEHARRLAQTGELFETIERALGGSMVATGDGGAGLSGGKGELRIVHRGVAPAGDDAIRDMIELGLRWDATNGTIVGTHAFAGGDAGDEEVLVEGVSYVSIRFYVGSRWRGSYDSASEGELPTAVEVAVWFGPPPALPEVAPARPTDVRDEVAPASDFEAMFADEFDALVPEAGPDALDAPPIPTRAPDRRHVFAVPDAPRAQAGVTG
ncbi:MAG: prepilin-type N-terminal cleavage/methylation domain-containing protein [Phycisphaerales bacterium]